VAVTYIRRGASWVPTPQTDVVRLISYRDKPYGSVVVTTERAAVLAAIWKEVSGMFGLTALVIGAICILQYGAISRVLRPAKDILAGLDSLARGDLSSRLPHFRLIELQRISEAFNTLAANLAGEFSSPKSQRGGGAVVHDDCRAAHLRETDCVAGHVGLELRNVDTNYRFERSHRFAGNPAEFWLWRLFAFELRRWGYAARA
jgi:HAMP domain-containing protein